MQVMNLRFAIVNAGRQWAMTADGHLLSAWQNANDHTETTRLPPRPVTHLIAFI